MELKRTNRSKGQKKPIVRIPETRTLRKLQNLQDSKKTSTAICYSLRLRETHRMEEERQRAIRNYFIQY